MWNPPHIKYKEQLERVQRFAAKIVSKNWATHGSEAVRSLGWATLEDRRKYIQLGKFSGGNR